MRPAAVAGVILIVLGVLGLALGGFSFTRKEKVLDLGPVEATADHRKSVPIPPLVGALAITGGVILLVSGRRRA